MNKCVGRARGECSLLAVLPYCGPRTVRWSPYNRKLVVAAKNHSLGSEVGWTRF